MARSDIVTQVPLDRAAKIMGIDPYHFNQITTVRRPETNACADIWFQYTEQRVGQLSRDDFAVALKQAEDTITHYLGYTLIPQWVVDEEQPITKPASPEMVNISGRNSRGQAKSVVTNRGFVIAGGIRTKTLIEANTPIIYSDNNGDGYVEFCTVTVNTTVTDPEEIHVYFPGLDGSDKWEIRPISVSISGGIATITFYRYLVPLPDQWTVDPDAGDILRNINGDDINAFLPDVDVYRVYNDVSSQATLYAEGTCLNCSGTGCEACGWTTNTACLRVRDSRRGIVTYSSATWNEDTEQFDFNLNCFTRDADKIILNYYAGLVNNDMDQPHLWMSHMWERMVVYYSLTLIDREMNGCENSRNIWLRQNEDLGEAVSSGNSSKTHTLTGRQAGNPLGTTRAGINLWRAIESNRLLQGH